MEKIYSLLQAGLLAGILASPWLGVSAQDYEDDLYYSPSQAQARERAAQAARQAAENAAGLGSAELYTAGSSNPLAMDIDAYNRRGADTLAAAAANASMRPDFRYTRRIERFHNPDVVSASNDTALIDYYYSTPSEQDVNVYVINNIDPSAYTWNYPTYPYYGWSGWGYPSFSFGWNSAWGWNVGWNWGWGPSWGYNPWYGPAWAWGPSWGWGHSWCWHHPAPPRPPRPWGYDRPGASRPHGPSYSGRPAGNYNPRRPGVNNSRRPGNFGYPSGGSWHNNTNGTVRPATPAGGNNNNGYRPSNNDLRGRNNNSGSSNNRYSTPNRNTSRPSYTPSTGGSRNSGGSYRSPGSGSRGGGGTGGGGSRGGGSRGRGR